MKISTLLAVVCLIGLIGHTFSLKCFLCLTEEECEHPEIEVCKNPKDSCLTGKRQGKALFRGCTPFDLTANSFAAADFKKSVQLTDCGIFNKLAASDQEMLKEAVGGGDTTIFCFKYDLCNHADIANLNLFPFIVLVVSMI
ncbi:hypothetical protein M3Y97_00917300 [Aphelenchoides bicaudatus]|nr:hypothetical protein M3Y97_00917300 [Aphelenchoides bicaudatus]